MTKKMGKTWLEVSSFIRIIELGSPVSAVFVAGEHFHRYPRRIVVVIQPCCFVSILIREKPAIFFYIRH